MGEKIGQPVYMGPPHEGEANVHKPERSRDVRGQLPSQHGVRVKVRHTEVREGKGPEAKGSQDNLR